MFSTNTHTELFCCYQEWNTFLSPKAKAVFSLRYIFSVDSNVTNFKYVFLHTALEVAEMDKNTRYAWSLLVRDHQFFLEVGFLKVG